MILIFGGAYQGKLVYAEENYRLDKSQVYYCTEQEPDTDKRIISGLHVYILALVKSGKDPVAHIKSLYPSWRDNIVICDDINGGVVPTDPIHRQWREAVGRCVALLARDSDEVVRVFCGIGQRIK